MKGKTFAQVLLCRIILPLSLLAGSILRQNLLSLVYFLLLLASPLIPRNKHEFAGAFRVHVILVLAYSSLVVLAQVVFQLYLVLYAAIHHQHYGEVLANNGTDPCSLIDTLQWIGFQRVDAPFSERYHSIRLLLPDVILLLVSIVIYVVLTKMYRSADALPVVQQPHQRQQGKAGALKKYIETFGELTIIILLGASSAMVPCVTSLLYFFIFFGVLVYWSLYLRFNHVAYSAMKMVVFAYLILHMVLLYLCQLKFLQTWLDNPDNLYYSRLMGMTPLFSTNCNKPWSVEAEDHTWPYFANPIILFSAFVGLSLDYAYHRGKTEIDMTMSAEPSPFRRDDALRTSEHQLLTNEQQPSYDAIGTSEPVNAEASGGDDTAQAPPTTDETDSRRVRKAWQSVYNFMMRNSYLLALFAMLLWAVVYPSWTSFVFLIFGCFLWLFPNTRRAALLCSPLLVIYAVSLTALQFVCSVNFGGKDYNTTLFFDVPDNYLVASIGLRGNDYPPVPIMIKMLFTMCFCVVLRELRRENRLRSEQGEDGALCLSPLTTSADLPAEPEDAARNLRSGSIDNINVRLIGARLSLWFSKYWIVAFYLLLLVMAIQEPYIYRLVYMVLFLYSAITFQLYYPFWRKTLKIFLTVVAIYSIVIIIIIYILSFHNVLLDFQRKTGNKTNWLADLGFDPAINYQDGESGNVQLLVRLLVPAFLLIAVMLQIHLFHSKFMEITDPAYLTAAVQDAGAEVVEQPAETTYQGFTGDVIKVYYKVRPHFLDLFYAACRLVTINLYKYIYVGAAVLITREASASGFVLLVILNLSLFFKPRSTLRKVCLLTAQFWVGLIILAKMLFQLRTVPKDSLMANCTSDTNGTNTSDTSELHGLQNDAEWLGLHTLPEGTGRYKDSLSYYIGGYVLGLVGLTILATFEIHDRFRAKVVALPTGITFRSITKENFDSSFPCLLGYLINFGFIKFGLEICFMVSSVVIFYRLDVVGAIYVLLLAILLLLSVFGRKHVRRIWFLYMVTLALLLPAQYLSSLGVPTTLCYEYSWIGKLIDNLRLWLYLPDYIKPPAIQVLSADCIQFVFVALQYQVFRMESKDSHPTIAAAGDNEELGPKPPCSFLKMHDFIDIKRSSADVIMSLVFQYWFWLCISILFITGTQNINSYCFGYLISCFYFFWHGLDFTMKDRRLKMRIWNAVLCYNFLVILAKTWLQILGCVFLDRLESPCIAVELFSMKCLNKHFHAVGSNTKDCGVSDKEAGLMWDIICFVMLLIQRRVFMSSYHLIVVAEEKSQATLSSRGAELINMLLRKRITKRQKAREREMATIKKKLERIRLRTLRLEGGSRQDWTHFDVIRSGEASMFEDGSDDDETTIPDTITDFGDADDESQREKANPMRMIVTTIDSGMESSIKKTQEEEADPTADDGSPAAAGQSSVQPMAAGHGFSRYQMQDDDEEGDAAGETDATDAPHSPVDPDIADPPERPPDDALKKIGEQAQTTDIWVKTFLISCMKWTIDRLNEISHDYRTVARQIDAEQAREKTKERERMMTEAPSEAPLAQEVDACDVHLEQHEEVWRVDLEKRSIFYRFFNALYLAVVARTEFICYFTMILCHLCNGNLLSLPLPIVAVLWGMLSLPRPAKTFWIVVLTYVMIVVVIKYIFQFSFWPWSATAITKWDDPRLLLGLSGNSCSFGQDDEKCQNGKPVNGNKYYATFELLILLSVFIHRSVLKRYGLWRNETEQEEDFRRFKLAESSIEVPNSPTVPDEASTLQDSSSSEQPLTLTKSKKRVKAGQNAVVMWYKNITSGLLFFKGDYYSQMVFCDFINFIISVFAFNSFVPPQNGSVQDYIQQNRIPVAFLILLLVQFVFIVIDRALYLRKSVLGRLIYHVFLVIVVHIWTFIVLPALTEIPFNQNVAAQLFYFIKLLYFGLSAWQIKSGYPTGVLGNFLTTKYSYLNLVLFKVFMIIPFLLELRCVMDWMWTATSMSIGTWFTMEDIFSKIFLIKCFREGEKEYPTKRATNRSSLVKYGLGGFILVALIFVIWFPLVIFSFANTIFIANAPIQCQMTVSIGGFQDIFTVRSQSGGIANITDGQLSDLKASLKMNSRAIGYLDNYQKTDIRTIRMNGQSTAIWGITEPSKDGLKKVLLGNDSLAVTVALYFTRQSKKGLTAGTISTSYSFALPPNSGTRDAVYNQLTRNKSSTPVELSTFLPRYIGLPAAGMPTAVSSLHCHPCNKDDVKLGFMPYRGLTLRLNKGQGAEYWSLGERGRCSQEFNTKCDENSAPKSYPELFFVTFSERVAPDSVSFITGYGIIGLYIGMVFVIGQFVRTLTSGGSYTIMFEELPNVDKIMKICKDLYFVREKGELDLEEELFAKLVYLYRSPKMLIEWTKLKVS